MERKLRISVSDLPARDVDRPDRSPDPVLRGLGAPEGAACRLNCDCRIGLLCVEGICRAS
jgi:hypothetical protein